MIRESYKEFRSQSHQSAKIFLAEKVYAVDILSDENMICDKLLLIVALLELHNIYTKHSFDS